MQMLKSFVYARLPSGEVSASEHDELGAWQRAVVEVSARASHVVLHGGFASLSPDHITAFCAIQEPGIYLTAAAAAIYPAGCLEPLEAVDQVKGYFRSLLSYTDRAARIDLTDPASSPAKRRGRPPKVRIEQVFAILPPKECSSFTEYLNFLWAVLGESKTAVLRGRWGCEGQELTHQQLGDAREPPVTRARIQQIEATAVKQVVALPETKVMLDRLKMIVETCALPVPLDDLPKLDAWFDSEAVSAPWTRNAIKALALGGLDVVEVEKRLYIVPFAGSAWKGAILQAESLLEEMASKETPVTQVEQRLAGLLPSALLKHGELLWKALEDSCQVAADAAGNRCLVACGLGAKEAIRAVLFEAPEPLHRDEIVALVQQRMGGDVSDMTIANALPQVGVLMARGYYGTRAHIPLSDPEIAALVEAAEEVVLTDPVHRQWSATEICCALRANGLFESEYLGPYLLGACLRIQSTKLQDKKRGVWAPPTDMPVGRIRIREFIIEMIEACGRPMSTDELKRELQERRGLSDTFQVQPRDRLFRLGTATWGLIDRDLRLSDAELTPYIDALKAQLLRTGQGIHVSEILPLLKQAGLDTGWVQDPEVFLTLGQRSGAMRVTMTRYLVLPEWGDERRLTPAHAILRAVRQDPRLTSIELATVASTLAGREVRADLVRSTLNDQGWGYRRGTQCWEEQIADVLDE